MDLKKIICVLLLFQTFPTVFCITTIYLSESCKKWIPISTKQIRIQLVRRAAYDPMMDCKVAFYFGKRVMIQFKDLKTEGGLYCNNDWLTIYNGNQIWLPKNDTIGQDRFCGQSTPSTIYESSKTAITLEFHSDHLVQYSGFDIIATQFHNGSCDDRREAQCSNGNCIPRSVAYDPCVEVTDCSDTNKDVIIIGFSVGSGVSVLLVVLIVYCTCRSIRTRGKTGHVVSEPSVATTVTSGNMSSTVEAHSDEPPTYYEAVYGIGRGTQQHVSTAPATA